MKVLIINSMCGVGSTGRIAVSLVETLKSKGNQGRVAFGLGKAVNIDTADTFKFNNKFGYYIHNVLAKITDHTGLYSTYATKRLIREIRKYDPDVINLHTIHGYYVNYEVLFKFLAEINKPIVWSLHDCWTFTGHCAHFVSADCYQWKSQCENCSLLDSYPKCYFKGDVKNNYLRKKEAFTGVKNLTFVAASQWMANFLKQSFFKDYDIQIIGNGIDTNVFKPQKSDFRKKYDIENNKIVLGVANVWTEKKGFSDMLTLSELLGNEYKVVMVGLTDDQLKTLPENIIGIKRTESVNELVEIYSASDVFVNPTYEDTFGLTTVEAQACGTPVVVYNTGGCPETVMKDFGAVVDCGDVKAMAEAVKIWVNKDIKINDDVFIFSNEKCYSEYIKLFESLCK